MKIGERISELINYYELNIASFSESIGLNNRVTLSRIIHDKSSPSYKIIEGIKEKYKEVNLNWLVAGSGEMFLTQEHEYTRSKIKYDLRKIIDQLD
jgi:hypothetical protein